MSKLLDTLKTQAPALPSGDRAELAHLLLDSLVEPEADVEASRDADQARRADEIRSGKVSGKPAEQVFAELRERFS